ncbi:MAG: hypothetical protein ABIH41_06910 [Nanoarchaeota archaeon]
MPITLEFIVTDQDTESVNPDRIHLAISDGCHANIALYRGTLPEPQQHSIHTERDADTSSYLYYMNLFVTEMLCFENGTMQLHCPQCGNDYAITRHEYFEAKDAFLDQLLERLEKSNPPPHP